MKKAPKYTAKVIKRETLTLAANGEFLSEEPTGEQKLLAEFQPVKKYMLVELFSDCGTITANTKYELCEKAWELNDTKQLGGDIFVHILNSKKAD